jgi:hypothetical protein
VQKSDTETEIKRKNQIGSEREKESHRADAIDRMDKTILMKYQRKN